MSKYEENQSVWVVSMWELQEALVVEPEAWNRVTVKYKADPTVVESLHLSAVFDDIGDAIFHYCVLSGATNEVLELLGKIRPLAAQ